MKERKTNSGTKNEGTTKRYFYRLLTLIIGFVDPANSKNLPNLLCRTPIRTFPLELVAMDPLTRGAEG